MNVMIIYRRYKNIWVLLLQRGNREELTDGCPVGLQGMRTEITLDLNNYMAHQLVLIMQM
jgi:hypothetical protein